jgi:hypothetical protein
MYLKHKEDYKNDHVSQGSKEAKTTFMPRTRPICSKVRHNYLCYMQLRAGCSCTSIKHHKKNERYRQRKWTSTFGRGLSE